MENLLDRLSDTVKIALEEDIGSGDATADLISDDSRVSARVISREPCVICGTAWFSEVFRQLDSAIKINWLVDDGENCSANDIICKLEGTARAILSGERAALNFLQTLSGTATTTKKYVDAMEHSSCQILDTRKTIPGLRQAQKYAVAIGGGKNHRIGLYDQILIKENHIQACGSISIAVATARHRYPNLKVEVETENLKEFDEAVMAGADIIMLDNYNLAMMQEAVSINKNTDHSHAKLEVSGNVTLESIAAIAATGVDFISSGDLTKNLQSIDFSMRFD